MFILLNLFYFYFSQLPFTSIRALSLSLLIFSKQITSLSLSLSFLSSLILSQKLPTQITSSSTDPDSFFTGLSTNQAPRHRSFLHRPIHEPSSTTQITCSPADPWTKLHKHRSISLLVCLCGFVCVWVCFCVDLSVWMCLCASEEKKIRSWGRCTRRRERKIGANGN